MSTPTQEPFDPNERDQMFQKGYAAGIKAQPATASQLQPAEAGFSTNMYLAHPIMGRQQFTFRGAVSDEWGFVLKDVERFCETMRAKGWKFDGEVNAALPTAAAPTPPADVKIVATEYKAAAAEMQKEYETVGNPPTGKTWIMFDATIVKVLPQPDEKVTLEFYAPDKKFPGVKVNKWKIPAADGLMKYVTSESMAKAAEYKLPCRVYYTEGAEGKTADGKVFHWKDVSHVRPIS